VPSDIDNVRHHGCPDGGRETVVTGDEDGGGEVGVVCGEVKGNVRAEAGADNVGPAVVGPLTDEVSEESAGVGEGVRPGGEGIVGAGSVRGQGRD
jgi:hypothetical protein